MNYYPFHIGDYVSATRHLSWDEDAAYRRLLDVYYTHEAPLPSDERKVFRLVMATTEDQREAVRVVLSEFFTMTDAGWVNRRADVEIQAMQALREKQREKANKRWKKIKPTDGESGAAMPNTEHGNAEAMPQHTDNHAAASFFDANAMPPTPTPTPTPTPEENTTLRFAGARAHEDVHTHEPKRNAALAILMRPHGIDITPHNPHLLTWVDADLSDTEALEAIARARQRKPSPARINAGYLNCIISDIIAERAKKYPAIASTIQGAPDSFIQNRDSHHAKKTNARASIYAIASIGIPTHDTHSASILGALNGLPQPMEHCDVS